MIHPQLVAHTHNLQAHTIYNAMHHYTPLQLIASYHNSTILLTSINHSFIHSFINVKSPFGPSRSSGMDSWGGLDRGVDGTWFAGASGGRTLGGAFHTPNHPKSMVYSMEKS